MKKRDYILILVAVPLEPSVPRVARRGLTTSQPTWRHVGAEGATRGWAGAAAGLVMLHATSAPKVRRGRVLLENWRVTHLNAVVHAGNGPYCLLVHGAIASRSYWMDNIDALAAVCRPVVVELWGHGNSPSPTGLSSYEPDAYVDEFEYLRQDLQAERWFTIGQSMGAALTLRYGLAYPDRVLGQVITNSNSAFTDAAIWMQRNHEFVVPYAERVEAEGPGALKESWFNPGRSRRLSERLRERLAGEFEQHTTRGIANSLRITNATLPLGDRVEQISVATLLTNGILEEGFQKLLAEVRRIPGLEEVELAGAHAVNGHDPDNWNRAVVGFLQRLTAGS